ncbi:MAG: alanine racemase [Gammaproteobacteria bacterium]|nr:alanine racemase [Gammaproteobacteria bacterium]
MQRSARLKIDFDALTHNLSIVRQYSADANIIAVIKANAYGHGMLAVARHLQSRVDALAVACIEEALVLRADGINAAIMVLQGFQNQYQLQQCLDFDLQPVCHQQWQIQLLSQADSAQRINCWLKIDTGMHRLGIAPEQALLAAQQLNDAPVVAQLRLMSHFANADDSASAFNQIQLDRFNQCQQALGLEASLANSAAILSMPNAIQHWVRPGIMLYGASPFGHRAAADFGLKPVMTLTSQVIAINSLSAGQALGYGSLWRSSRDSQIAVVGIGYGDGYPRHANNGTPVWLNGQRLALVGQVSMDMICVDISDCDSTVNIGDEVTLWGGPLDINEVAEAASTISYELLCHCGKDQ